MKEDPLIAIAILVILLAVSWILADAGRAWEEESDRKNRDVITGFRLVILFLVGAVLFPLVSALLWYQALLCYLGVLLLFLVLGNFLPARLAARNPEQRMERTKGLVGFLSALAYPVRVLTKGILFLVVRIARINPQELEEGITEEEIIDLVKEGNEQGVLEDSEVAMINNIIDLDEKEVRDIMTHRKQIVGIEVGLTPREALDMMLKESFSRYPLYKEEIDNILGILYLKDLSRACFQENPEEKTLEELARKPFYVADTQSIDDVFHEMQKEQVHMAVAVDEYGQTSGLIAMEDILEEIVGNILDEYDKDERFVVKINENRFILRGLTPLDQVKEALGLSLESEEYETLNGFLISLLGRIPEDGEHPSVSYERFRFQIMEVKENMIQYVKAVREPKREETKEEQHESE